ncbi:hypothetical protein DASC09_034420 [Saccharomycopsis crataegensis]|uniref:Vacuolar membrane protein n=1 Tax=Saccharomycopsis crataegensis TaxID=43959 RepID=A0AAV5QMT8_9ASCO|nr:hypothetical protein DASC09_034420 [Saccharomycopsis crataegensis]
MSSASSEAQCKLLGPFSLIVQSLLGLLSLSSLIYKRYKEYPNRRPWKVWFFDVSKQVFGAIGIHFLNLLLSILGGSSSSTDPEATPPVDISPFAFKHHTSENGMSPSSSSVAHESTGVSTINFYLNSDNDISNPCNWYFLNILFDTTIGVPILWGLLYVIFNCAKKAGIEGINSGQYGIPPRMSSYVKQLILYFIGLFSMKLLVYILLMSVPIFEDTADWLLSVFDPFPRMQVFMVTFVTPLVMNSLQYVLIDNIIQSPEYKKPKAIGIPYDMESSETLFDNEQDNAELARANLPEEGLLGQPEPEVLEGEFLKEI